MTSSPTLKTYQTYLGSGDFSDIFLEDSKALSIRWEGGRIESAAVSEESGGGPAVFKGS